MRDYNIFLSATDKILKDKSKMIYLFYIIFKIPILILFKYLYNYLFNIF